MTFTSSIHAQTLTIRKKVANAKAGEPLSFANDIANNSARRCSNDIAA